MGQLNLIVGNNFSGRTAYLKDTTNNSDESNIYVGPPQTSYFTGLSETVDFELKLHNRINSDINYSELLGIFASENLLSQNPFKLSGGEQVLITVLSSFLLNPQIINIDIILEQLSKEWKIQLFNIFEKFNLKEINIVDNRVSELTKYVTANQIKLQNTSNKKYKISGINKQYDIQNLPNGIVEIENLNFKYQRSKVEVFKNFNLMLEPGNIYHLKGNNGAGKSTLAKILTGVLRNRNSIKYNKKKINPFISPGYYFGYCFQNPDEQLFSSTVKSELNYLKDKKNNQLFMLLTESFGISEMLNINPFDLPFVLRKIIAIAATLSIDRPWYIFDEPSYGLDNNNVKALASIFKYLSASGKGIIIISHSEVIFKEFDDIKCITLIKENE